MHVWITVKWDIEDAEALAVHHEEADAVAFVEAHNAADEFSTWRRCDKPFPLNAHEWVTRSGTYGIYIRRYEVK